MYVNPNSNTFLIHGSRVKWEGNAGYSDNHVEFLTQITPCGPGYKDTAELAHPDTLFYDEPDDAGGRNAFLGIFIKAGPQRQDFRAIWD